ncbi:glutaminyl-peptide cyclotransferase [Ophiostoma piceae UAMH 11346]|uniref:Peptide hydrolase n=1 Tax=Ophiostoma piceae (strain UAMH 11346) TaxID=1262450 RepID=S3CGM7_OPHP1|nr:glutaminyl-peptide cyclotransferase [Ophiostoma piceae UAMH 11346]
MALRTLVSLLSLSSIGHSYKPLSDNFLNLVPAASAAELDPANGDLLASFLQPRAPGSAGHADVQDHLVQWFATNLPDWTVEWQNSTAYTPSPKLGGKARAHRLENLVFRREPPWTRPGQANLLTFAAHYATPLAAPLDYVGATDAAVSCALMLHVARSLDRFAAQMYREMQELGEGGTVPMDMGLQVVFIDGVGATAKTGDLSGSEALASAWEHQKNPALPASLYGYPNRLNQISMLVLLDLLGTSDPRVPSRYITTHWAYRAMATVEHRLRKLGRLETDVPVGERYDAATTASATNFLPDMTSPVHQYDLASGWATDTDDHVPFMRRGISVLPVIPDSVPEQKKPADLDMKAVHDWSMVLTGFALEWLDMMEVEPQPEKAAGEVPAQRQRRWEHGHGRE